MLSNTIFKSPPALPNLLKIVIMSPVAKLAALIFTDVQLLVISKNLPDEFIH